MRTQDTPVRKYLVALTVGYSERANVNATVHKVRSVTLIDGLACW
jgi:hypothetical protein